MGRTKPKVLVTEEIDPGGWTLLQQATEPIAWPGIGRQLLSAAVQDVQAILVKALPLTHEVIQAAPQLKVIAKHGVDCSNISIPAATAAGVRVTNTPQAMGTAVAEHALALLLALARRIGNSTRDLTQGQLRPPRVYQGVELSGKALGLIGVRRSGARLAQMAAQGFGMRVLGFDPDPEGTWPEGVERCLELRPLVAQADCLSLHLPLTPETHHLIGRTTLPWLKPSCLLVSTAHGGLVDEAAVADFIRWGRLGGVGLDVLEDEALRPAHPLTGLPNVLLTPRVAGSTEEAMQRMAQEAAEEILRVLHGEPPRYPVNPEVLSGGSEGCKLS